MKIFFTICFILFPLVLFNCSYKESSPVAPEETDSLLKGRADTEYAAYSDTIDEGPKKNTVLYDSNLFSETEPDLFELARVLLHNLDRLDNSIFSDFNYVSDSFIDQYLLGRNTSFISARERFIFFSYTIPDI
jgi:hypothetical protein